MDADPALVDVEVVEQGALDDDQPGAQCLRLRAAPIIALPFLLVLILVTI